MLSPGAWNFCTRHLHCTPYIVQCTTYTARRIDNVQCTVYVYSVQHTYTSYTTRRTLFYSQVPTTLNIEARVKPIVYTVHCTVYTVCMVAWYIRRTLYSVLRTLYTVRRISTVRRNLVLFYTAYIVRMTKCTTYLCIKMYVIHLKCMPYTVCSTYYRYIYVPGIIIYIRCMYCIYFSVQ